MLVLPVRTRTLVFWPMLYGSLGVVLLWLFTAVLVCGPSGYSAPILLPCLALAALMAWVHSLAWLPITNHLLRLEIILVVVLALAVRFGRGTLGGRDRRRRTGGSVDGIAPQAMLCPPRRDDGGANPTFAGRN